ncbi:unnamed protein product [Brugia timori]|uniref:Uncharacterized protein n=1 Tax=Brugia timori TaxID=42155 RepID=A0A0R3QFP7_9BILA|nr:unnamed protein product [Brugia timori]
MSDDGLSRYAIHFRAHLFSWTSVMAMIRKRDTVRVLVMETASVPSRIVLMGTSKISLNERFSQIPVPKLRHSVVPIRSYNSIEQSYREPILNRRPLYIDDVEVS